MKNEVIKIGMKPAHPGGFIKTEVLDELGLSVTKAADVLGVRRATLSGLLNEKAALSAEIALRLKKRFQVNMDMLLRMQAWYDATEMKKRQKKSRFHSMFPHETF
jgi:addiction module HigA family antidote